MEKEIDNQVQEAQRVPYRINPRRNRPRHILIKHAAYQALPSMGFPGKSTGVGCHCLLRLIKLTKTKHKERILKAAREKQQVTYKGNPYV